MMAELKREPGVSFGIVCVLMCMPKIVNESWKLEEKGRERERKKGECDRSNNNDGNNNAQTGYEEPPCSQ